MELRDYLTALRRHWAIWVGATLAGALVALGVFVQTPKTYEATATVFVSVSPSIPNSASFVQQRVKSYPEIVTSEAVLAPVMTRLDLEDSLADLRARVSATNPADTTQLHVTVSGTDPDQLAAIANEVADSFADVVETLETPSSGDEPVHLTVADPAVTPESPASPVLLFLLALGVAGGLLLGLAGAVIRSRVDSRVHTEDGLRRAWDGDDVPEVLAQPSGRTARRSVLTGETAAILARRLELRSEERPARVVLLSPSPAQVPATRTFAEDVVAALHGRGVDATVTGSDFVASAVPGAGPRVRLEVADPLAPLRVWKQVADSYDGVVLVLVSGRVDGGELQETQRILRSAGIRPFAVALLRRGSRSRKGTAEPRVEVPAVPAPSEAPKAKSGKQPAVNGAARS